MEIPKIQANIIFSQQIDVELEKIVKQYSKEKIFILTENSLKELCLPAIQLVIDRYNIKVISIEGGEKNKIIASCEKIWQVLSQETASRKSLLINIGGGLITDLGGFVASVFKRGIKFVNIPTTLLSQVDASIGGKTGVNFGGLKNEIGAFNKPEIVIINTSFLKTIDKENFLSGFAEMLKHGLLKSKKHFEDLKRIDIDSVDYEILERLIIYSNSIKEWYIENDFKETGIRKALNFGHTIGHAFESYALYKNKPILHGYAVAYGMMIELYISSELCKLPKSELNEINSWLLKKYGKFEIEKKDYLGLLDFMNHDKKNELGKINFTLLKNIGEIEINKNCSQDIIIQALDYYRKM